MRFRFGVLVGFAIGYYFGARAGRARYVQMERWLQKARESDLAEAATEKAKAVIDLTMERARDLLPQSDQQTPAPTGVQPTMAPTTRTTPTPS